MHRKSVFYYHVITALIIGAYSLFTIAPLFTEQSALANIVSHRSENLAVRLLFGLFVTITAFALLKPLLFRKRIFPIVLAFDSFLISFIVIDVIYSLAAIPHSQHTDIYIVSENIVSPDSVSGYRYQTGHHRQVYLFNGKKVFDARFRANNLGFTSQTDFARKKTSGITRWLVLGDSFTSASYNDLNWVDMLNRMMQKDSLHQFEFYSFSLEGIGVPTWHDLFFKEIIDEFDFDGVVLPIYHEDIFRPRVILFEQASGVHCIYTDSLPQEMKTNYLYTNFSSGQIAITSSDDKIDEVISHQLNASNQKEPFRLRLLENIIAPSLTKLIYQAKIIWCSNQKPAITDEAAIQLLHQTNEGRRGEKMLAEIISYCQKNNKQVIISSVPDNYLNDVRVACADINEESLIRALASYYKVPYFSGYRCFDFITPEQTSEYFHADGHWNMKGSEIFAGLFYDYFKSNYTAKPDSLPGLKQR